MSDHPPVQWPGPAPAPYDFPFDEAATARNALEELRDEVTDLRSIHADAHAGLSDANQGDTIRQFDAGYRARLAALSSGSWQVTFAINALDDLVAAANRARVEREDAHRAWANSNDAYQTAVANGDPVEARPHATAPRPAMLGTS